MKVTNTEHTAINGNQSKCRMTQFNLGGALTKSGGDFNCYIGQGGVSKQTGTFEQCIEYMRELGLHSEYHERAQEAFGKESSYTYHHQFKDDMPFFIDFTFTNIPLFAYMIGSWERNMSDHSPQIIVI